jgi:hypothetical protein
MRMLIIMIIKEEMIYMSLLERMNITIIIYEILHEEKIVAQIDTQGRCRIYLEHFMPYNLYLEEIDNDFDTQINNVLNFNFWCASRILTLDRKYAKMILNTLGLSQSMTDKDRAKIALFYHCLCLSDVYWVRMLDEPVTFQEVNLYDNHLENALIDVSLRGKQITLENKELTKGVEKDLSTDGCFPKAWIRNNNQFQLLKGGDISIVKNEILASKICQCFHCSQVIYKEGSYKGELVSISNLFTSKRYSIVSKESFDIYAINHDVNTIDYILSLDAYSYYMMNILDYLTGNTDRHWGNWGFLIDNQTNTPISLHPLMDFNQAFNTYDSIEGANCLTTPVLMTQKEAAIEAVKKIGLNQIKEVNSSWFQNNEQKYEMFLERLSVLKGII